ncbi:IS3 family transposase [Desemzia sp. RIT804]|nr:IS3 family transposase [Desemzia sp. RIT 804]
MEEFIHFYNTERFQGKLKGLTSLEKRNQALVS